MINQHLLTTSRDNVFYHWEAQIVKNSFFQVPSIHFSLKKISSETKDG